MIVFLILFYGQRQEKQMKKLYVLLCPALLETKSYATQPRYWNQKKTAILENLLIHISQ